MRYPYRVEGPHFVPGLPHMCLLLRRPAVLAIQCWHDVLCPCPMCAARFCSVVYGQKAIKLNSIYDGAGGWLGPFNTTRILGYFSGAPPRLECENLRVKLSMRTHTAAPHCGSHCHAAPRILTLRVLPLQQQNNMAC